MTSNRQKKKNAWRRHLHKGYNQPLTPRLGVFKIYFRNQLVKQFTNNIEAEAYLKKYKWEKTEWSLVEVKPPEIPKWTKKKIITETNNLEALIASQHTPLKEPIKKELRESSVYPDLPLNQQKLVFIKRGTWKEGLSWKDPEVFS